MQEISYLYGLLESGDGLVDSTSCHHLCGQYLDMPKVIFWRSPQQPTPIGAHFFCQLSKRSLSVNVCSFGCPHAKLTSSPVLVTTHQAAKLKPILELKS